ncbi:MAG: sigma-70 family RNA polymerase sigma factor [Candidatus Pseudobacter hemicellulosilyticus]|uniref:RNA polymerase sigma factor n=1 Tax=Candidatus Pseudobacter hemicellulosilyticus TaxID=3121375 RepID=A0AAJ6BHK9_9BACT|nr:MAG: sigma-70 family RNA polymerase sigma factor [Pseudobacter sp.]
MHSGLNDKEIINRVLRGEQQQFALLVERYQNFVFTIALRYAPHREDAEEIAQDVFVKAYRNLADFRGEAKFSTWLYTIVSSTCLSFLRKKKLTVHSLDNEQVLGMASSLDAGGRTNRIEQQSRARLVNQALQLLSADDARIITLFYKGEQSLEEIGRILKLETNTVKVKLFRARQRLREKMELHFKEEVGNLVD